LTSFLNDGEKIGFRIQFFCTKCNTILSPKKLVDGCPKCSQKLDLSLR
jgi:Zn finger protein HypA/HybF involved in hydrogenase expression